MKAIIEYSDFRQYMRDFYEERKLRHVFSWREFSKAAGFTSSSYMKVVCDGKSNLSRIGVERTGQAMGLVGFEMDYFRAMVNFGQETDEAKKKAAYEEMLEIARVHKVRVVEGDLFEFYESWRNPVLRELAPLMPGATPGELAKMCYTDVSAADIKQSLDFLVKAKHPSRDPPRQPSSPSATCIVKWQKLRQIRWILPVPNAILAESPWEFPRTPTNKSSRNSTNAAAKS